jgi:hypothetical protein
MEIYESVIEGRQTVVLPSGAAARAAGQAG